jgi:hypothetical protein
VSPWPVRLPMEFGIWYLVSQDLFVISKIDKNVKPDSDKQNPSFKFKKR